MTRAGMGREGALLQTMLAHDGRSEHLIFEDPFAVRWLTSCVG